jgi:hypothetical protein
MYIIALWDIVEVGKERRSVKKGEGTIQRDRNVVLDRYKERSVTCECYCAC